MYYTLCIVCNPPPPPPHTHTHTHTTALMSPANSWYFPASGIYSAQMKAEMIYNTNDLRLSQVIYQSRSEIPNYRGGLWGSCTSAALFLMSPVHAPTLSSAQIIGYSRELTPEPLLHYQLNKPSMHRGVGVGGGCNNSSTCTIECSAVHLPYITLLAVQQYEKHNIHFLDLIIWVQFVHVYLNNIYTGYYWCIFKIFSFAFHSGMC